MIFRYQDRLKIAQEYGLFDQKFHFHQGKFPIKPIFQSLVDTDSRDTDAGIFGRTGYSNRSLRDFERIDYQKSDLV